MLQAVPISLTRAPHPHTPRVGRTGRAGDKEGAAFSLLLPKDAAFASALVQSLALAGQAVSPELHELAMRVRSFVCPGFLLRLARSNRAQRKPPQRPQHNLAPPLPIKHTCRTRWYE